MSTEGSTRLRREGVVPRKSEKERKDIIALADNPCVSAEAKRLTITWHPACPSCQELERRVRKLEQDNAKLERENARLRAQLEEAHRAGKRQASPFSKGDPKKDPKKPGRKPGKAYGKRHSRPRPDTVDEVVDVPLAERCCPDCGGELGEEEVHEQFQTDIPRVEPHSTQFNIHSATCKRCGHRVQARHPKQISDALGAASCQMGPNVITFGAHLNKVLGASYEKISGFFSTAFDLTVGRSTLARAVNRLGEKGQPIYSEIISCIRNSDVVYPDETGWKIGGRKAWLWNFVSLTNDATAYVIRCSRGFDVAEEILGADYSGVLGRDGWKVYDRFESAGHQICLAHILRRCDRVLEIVSKGAVKFPRALKELLKDSLDLRNRRDAGLVSPHGVLIATGRLQNRLDDLLDGNFTNEENRKLANYVNWFGDDVFTFLKNPAVEATNWPAEQAIRPAVVNRKMSGGNRSERGARAQAVLMSIFRTAWQRGLDSTKLLVDLLRSREPERFAQMALGP